nr:immunoglobulin light chain junction region [Macaca mulatta]
CQQYNRLPYTF